MTEITYTDLRRRLTGVLDRVANQNEIFIILRQGKKEVAMIPAEELAGLMETRHLLRSARNARRLFDALSRVPAARSRGGNSSRGRRQC